MKPRVLLAVCIVFCSMALSAAPKQGDAPLAFEPAKFANARSAIERDLQSGDRYKEIVGEDREAVLAALGRLSNRLSDVKSLDQLDEKSKLEVFNDQELVNNILTKAQADSRVICKREAPTGSRMAVNICKTVAQRRRELDAARGILEGQNRSHLRPPAGG